MSTPLGEVHLRHPGGAIVLRRAYLAEQGEDFDVGAFRGPFGKTWHRVGTGQPRSAPLLHVTGVLEGVTRVDSDELRDEALAALPAVMRVDVGDWQIPVDGAVGVVPVTPTERGWRLTVALVRAGASAPDDRTSSLAFDDPANSGWVGVL